MKRHLNTLYVTSQKAYLAKEGECIVVRVEGETRGKVPALALDGIVCFGQVSYSPFLLAHCAENGIAISHLTETGRFLARIHGETSGNVLLRREQYRWADDPVRSAAVARGVLIGKVYNARIVLLRGARETEATERATALAEAAEALRAARRGIEAEGDLDRLRGLEGEAAQIYWRVYPHLLRTADAQLRFAGRSRRPPLDPVNALLSFLYTVLVHDVRAALEAVGLDPYVGYLHRDRPGRPGLALDLMEEFRAWTVDRLVATLINRGQLGAADFVREEAGAVRMTDDARRLVLTSWQERKKEVVTHPFLDEKMPIGLLWHTQALLLARTIRGDLDAYPAFLWR